MAKAIRLLFVIFLSLDVVYWNHSVHSTCLKNFQDIKPRQISYLGQELDLTIQTTNRIGHRLITEVLKIFYEDILRYERVRIVEGEDRMEMEEVFSNMYRNYSDYEEDMYKKVPNALVNLQMMVTPNQDLRKYLSPIGKYPMIDLGVSVPQGRFGWYIPEKLARVTEGCDHWRFFRDPVKTKIFDLIKEERLLNNYSMDSNGKYFCSSSNCKNGYFIPQQCKNLPQNQSCAVLLSSYPDTTDFVIGNIIDLKLYIKVLWLGPNLRIAVDKITDIYVNNNISKSVAFLEWTPGYFTLDREKLVSIALPDCEILKWPTSHGCKYELTNTVKIVWDRLENLALPAFTAAHMMFFNRTEYINLLNLHYGKAGKRSTYDTACAWIKDNKNIWNNWHLNMTKRQKKPIYLAGIFPMSATYHNGYGIMSAAVMAKEAINANSSILRDYRLEIKVTDGRCDANVVLQSFINLMHNQDYNQIVGVLGPACSETIDPLAGITPYYSTTIMSYSADGSNLGSRYPYFFRTIGENKQYIMVYLHLFERLGWTKFGTMALDGQKHTEYISDMEDILQKNGINGTVNIKIPVDSTKESIERQMLKLKKSRIIIADMYDPLARQVMCTAHKLKMTLRDGYVWFLPSWLTNKWYNTTHFNRFGDEDVECSPETMLEAINGTFMLSYSQYAEEDAIMEEGLTVGEWKKNYQMRVKKFADSYRASPERFMNLSHIVDLEGYNFSSVYAGYAYDAVWAYALALEKLTKIYSTDIIDVFSEFHRNNTTVLLRDLLQKTDFYGVSGHIKFYGSNSRYPTINIKQVIGTSTQIIGKFTPNVTNTSQLVDGTLELNENAIIWLTLDGKKPVDFFDEDCLLQGVAQFFDISCSEAVVVVNILIFTLLGSILIGIVIVIKRRYEQKMKLTRDYMRAIGFDTNSAFKMTNLDKWEVPREKVVINRSIGSGAFGTVYGGEALLNENEGWVSVAVKMLQYGATTEQKMDFLSEAESMKRFEHKNIVKLLGVCTKNEPVYTIMEFMLYGDLKTYLLARRDLVKTHSAVESSEISSKRLTSMALDIARALSYLAQLKYVHRDIACRNCLVNSQRVVKLGDFGMTRLIFESDYYRFSRKGMLPVRWMAPESLGLGIFTVASDVWSYGVLLYEIITFGSFPFQGLSNNEVLEKVKNGQTLTIPGGVRPQLKGLMKSCWSREYTQRPQISEIANYLANNPYLLTPCLDVPLSSVELDCSTSFNMLPEIINKQNSKRKSNLINFERSDSTTTPTPILNNTRSSILNNTRQFDNMSYVVAENKLKETNENGFITSNESVDNDESEPFV